MEMDTDVCHNEAQKAQNKSGKSFCGLFALRIFAAMPGKELNDVEDNQEDEDDASRRMDRYWTRCHISSSGLAFLPALI